MNSVDTSSLKCEAMKMNMFHVVRDFPLVHLKHMSRSTNIKSWYVMGDSRAHVTISILCPTLLSHHIQIVKVQRHVLYVTDSLTPSVKL